MIIYRGESCRGCVVKGECTRGPARRISRDGKENLLEVMREKLRSEEGKQIYNKRAYTVEPVLGHLKWNRRKPMMSLRGSEKVRGEFSLMCLVHNVKKTVKRVLEGSLLWLHWCKASQAVLPGHRMEAMTLVGAQV